MTSDELRQRLYELEDPAYREFHLRTCPQAKNVIGVRIPEQRKLAREITKAAWFVPLIHDWATCDVFCSSFKFKTSDLSQVWDFITTYRTSSEEYELRFMLVMMLDHFLLPEYLDRIFAIIDQLKSEQYYVNMATAWLVAEAFAKHRDATLDYLSHDQLSVFTHNKAIQKARESRRVSPADKQTLLGMKL